MFLALGIDVLEFARALRISNGSFRIKDCSYKYRNSSLDNKVMSFKTSLNTSKKFGFVNNVG